MASTISPPEQDRPAMPAGAAPPGWLPEEPPSRGRSTATRLLLGALAVVILSAVATLVLIAGEIGSVKTAISQNPSLNLGAGTLAAAPSGAPQTLLLVGDDRRALTQYYHRAVASHSNEMLLVRFDPSKPWISMLSIPRELWVPIIPDNGAPPLTNRINFAYTLGGSQLMTETIKRVLGLSVNHVIVIDFGHFKHAIDQMGCVYSTIDRRYYHSNVGSVEQYQEINLQPGYQKLCGAQALQFVSYRHGDTSLVRDARNQAFLLDVKKQFGPSLFANRHRFEQIFGQAVQTDPALHTTSGLLDLLTLLAQSAGRPVRQVHFQANLGPSFDTATPQQIQSTVNLFVHGNPVQPQKHTAAVAHAVGHRVFRRRLPLVGTPASALTAARSAARGLPFPLEYPRVRNQLPAAAADAVRVYAVRDPQGTVHSAYVVVIDRGQLGQFYDVQGMRWSGAPMFDRPDQTVTAGGRSYLLYYEGSNLKMVAWHEFGAVYWVRNTLTDDVGNTEMLAIAEQTSPLAARTAGRGRGRAYLGAFGLPARPAAQPAGGDLPWLGAAASALALLGMAFLAVRLQAGRAELAALRAQIPVALMLDAQARALAATHGVSLGGRARALAPAPRRRWMPPGRRGLAAVAAGVVAAVGAAAGLYAFAGSSPSTHGKPMSAGGAARTPAAAAPVARDLAPASVAVLNATGRAGAAHALAQQLTAGGVLVNIVGNLAPDGQSAGLSVFYAAGRETQARAIVRTLSQDTPTLAPLDPATSAAAGGQAQIVVVLH